MAIYSVAETTNMLAVRGAARIFNAVADFTVENGMFGHLEELAKGYSHVYRFVLGEKAGYPTVMVKAPEWQEDECRITNQRKDQFCIEEGVVFRAYVVSMNDEIALSAKGFVGEPEVGKFATIDATGRLAIADEAAEGKTCFEIMRKRTQGATLVTSVRDYGYAQVMYTAKVKSLA